MSVTTADVIEIKRRALTEWMTTSRDAGALLESFLGWSTASGVELYSAQEEAILEIFDGNHVILNTPTGSGKSLVAVASHFYALARGERSVYTSPIKALVSEKFFSLCDTFGAEHVGMLTGDASINARAPIICCTAEVLANMTLRAGARANVQHVIMDEFHYYGDRDRGVAWQLPLLVLKNATFLLMSATLGELDRVVERLHDLTGRAPVVVKSTDRPVPLDFTYVETPLLETVQDLIERKREPVYVVNFSQREAAELAQSLTSTNFATAEQKQAIVQNLRGFRFDSPYGTKMRRYVTHGIGLHHAGLLPKYRLLVERLAQLGLMRVICGTDTLGVGVNVPIRTVLFSKLYKYDGERRRILSVRDFMQIAGRAGRKGFDDQGYVVCQAPAHVIENKKLEAKASSGKGGKKKFVKKQPEKGYVPYDAQTFETLRTSPPEELTPSFHVDHAMILNVLQRPDDGRGDTPGYRALVELIARSDEHAGRQSILRRSAARLFRALRDAGLVELERREGGSGSRIILSEELQDDFSVFQTLALYLLETLPAIDLDADDHALRILTLVESILDNPTMLLIHQERALKGELIQELKAEGMDYEDRMNELEKVTYLRPDADFIYETFNAFEARHPWVGQDNIRPKSIAREMYERWLTFNEYVGELGVERAEGVLLRYLSQVYKTLSQTVPEAYRSEEVTDVIAYLRAMLERVDSSLLSEWEKMLDPGDEALPDPAARPRRDISRNVREFHARIRAELHALVKAISRRDWEEAAACVYHDDDDPWTAERWEAAFESYFEAYDALVFDHRARLSEYTRVQKSSEGLWSVSQILLDPDGNHDWAIEATVDLRDDPAPEGLLLRVAQVVH